MRAQQPDGPELAIDQLDLDTSSDVPHDVWQSLASSIKQTELRAYPGWVEELREVEIVGGLRNEGYYRAEATAKTSDISRDPAQEHVSLTVHVEAGPLYTLSAITFRPVYREDMLSFPEAQLRPLIPLQDGQPFSVSKIREGLDQLQKIYRAHGYIDVVSTPSIKPDDKNHRIALEMDVQEGKPFAIGRIDVAGLDSVLETELRMKLHSGDVLNFQIIQDFYREHQSELPEEDWPGDTDIHRDVKQMIADLSFDFRGCAQIANEQSQR